MPSSKKDKLLRFHEPPPFWGPKAKPKRATSEEETNSDGNSKTKVNFLCENNFNSPAN
jgi:hypothetical protein